MRKRLIFGLAIASAMFAACSNDETVDVSVGDAIGFRTSIDRATRSNIETTASLDSFKVTAIGSNDLNYFTDLMVKKQGSTWKTANTYYWPTYALQFYAYANGPAAGKGTVTINKDGKQITGYTPAAKAADQKDLLVAYNSGTRATNNGTPVPLTFKHALSQIEVKAKCLNPATKIEVIGVKLVNMATKADFTFPESVLNTTLAPLATYWSNWTDLNDPAKAYYINGQTAVTLNDSAKSIMFGENNFMVIPQQLTAWNAKLNEPAAEVNKQGAYLAVLCRVSNVSNGNETLIYPTPTTADNKAGKYAYSAVAINTLWLPGKKYVYTLTFCGPDGGAGKIDPNPVNPGTDGTGITEVTPGTGGEDILGGPIEFTVTVDDWENEDVAINM